MKKILYLFLTVSLIFSSCKKDEDDLLGCTDTTAINYNALANTEDGTCTYSIVGNWNMTSAVIDDVNLFNTSLEPHLVSGVWNINSNGSYSENMLNSFNYNDIVTGTWSLNGDVFSMTGGDSDDGITNFTVITLDANNLILSGLVEIDDGIFGTLTCIFTR
tara:strand:+ start:178 stop:660 length:483 start_codon:yes stop_codon:yes gene_type:complete